MKWAWLGILGMMTACETPLPFIETLPHQAEWQQPNGTVKTTATPAIWWHALGDKTLSTLLEDAAKNNFDLRIALEHITRARALRQAAASGYFPKAEADSRAAQEGLSGATSRNRSNQEKERNSYSANITLTWELDVFGRVADRLAEAEANLAAEEALREGLTVSILAETAENYFSLRGNQKKRAAAVRNLALLDSLVSIAEAKQKAGNATAYDVLRAKAERDTVSAAIPAFDASIQEAANRLALLTGQAPETTLSLVRSSAPLSTAPNVIPAGLRSDLLKRRPDIREARARISAATASLGLAEKALFPELSLTGGVGSEARLFTDWFTPESLTNQFAGLLAWSLFEGGAQMAAIEAAEATQRAALLSYQQSVLMALSETETALSRYGLEWQRLGTLREAEEKQQAAAKIARLRYQAGETDFTTVIEAERASISAEAARIESETELLNHLTLVYKTLAGGWDVPVQ